MSPLQVFDVREPLVPDYQVPVVNVLNDDSGGLLVLPPDAPELLYVVANDAKWEPVDGATGYYVEAIKSGTVWTVLANVAAPAVRLQSSSITSPGYYRVKAYNSAGVGLPSNAILI